MAVAQSKAQHVMIMGDFNLPEIDYNTGTVSAGDMAASILASSM
jgi:endonuclease/exonuclease/phosphatase family metal-dependent hydrolase